LIPNPLTLLLCWLLGKMLADAVGCVLQFAGEICADVVRYGWAAPGFFNAALLVIGAIAVFASGFFIGGAMRLLAEKPWPKAAGWAILSCFLAAVVGGMRRVSPLFLVATAGGCLLGAYLCERHRDEHWLSAAEGFMRSWMFWERGGAF
jgi:hypothetical protein